jgi:hypothetical protein
VVSAIVLSIIVIAKGVSLLGRQGRVYGEGGIVASRVLTASMWLRPNEEFGRPGEPATKKGSLVDDHRRPDGAHVP